MGRHLQARREHSDPPDDLFATGGTFRLSASDPPIDAQELRDEPVESAHGEPVTI